MRVLVTGSSGFVGHWLLSHLDQAGDDAVTLSDDLDVRDAGALREAVAASGAEGIVHLAAQASVGLSWQDAHTTFEINALGTLHLLDAAYAAGPRPRVLLVSSAEVYGLLSPGDLPVGEDHPFAPTNPYAASKAAAELLGIQAWLGRGLEVMRARPFNHTGPGQRADFVVPSLARQVVDVLRDKAGEVRVGNLDVRRDITDVRDVVRAYRLLLDGGTPGAAYNVCSGVSLPIADIAGRLLGIAGVDAPVVVDPDRVRPVDQPDLRGNPARLSEATGWCPEIDLDRTLGDVLGYWSSLAPEPAGP